VNTTAQVGGALGLAVLATLATTRSVHLSAAGHSSEAALIGGYHLAFWIAAALLVAALAIGAALLSSVAAPIMSAEVNQPAGTGAGADERRQLATV
jgi:hypothetical protein